MKQIRTVLLMSVGVTMLSAFALKDTSYKIDAEKSKITWLGKKVTGQHTGTIQLLEGSFAMKGKKVAGGSFAIDMTSLKDADGNARLEAHLKNDDFFSAEKFPKATFVISTLESKGKDQYLVKGDLTIKGITNPIEFPATIQATDGLINAKANIVVDRTKFDIKFRSGNFFENLGDKTIEDNFELGVELVGAPAAL